MVKGTIMTLLEGLPGDMNFKDLSGIKETILTVDEIRLIHEDDTINDYEKHEIKYHYGKIKRLSIRVRNGDNCYGLYTQVGGEKI